MNPLEMDHILKRVLGHLSHPIDLKNCRLVNQLWNSLVSTVLNDRGATIVVSDENYQEFFNNRSKHIAGLNLAFNLTGQPDGWSPAMLAMTKELIQDRSKTGTGSYCVKSINFHAGVNFPDEWLLEIYFWRLVELAARNLEHLLVAGALVYFGPPEEQKDSSQAIEDTKFPVLKSVTFDIRYHIKTNLRSIPPKLALIVNKAPRLEEYKLLSDHHVVLWNRNSASTQLGSMPTEVTEDVVATATGIQGIAGQLKTFGFFIMEGDGPPLGHPFRFGQMTLRALRGTRFQNLQSLTVVQVYNYLSTPEFLQFLTANARTLSSLEYTFVFAIGVTVAKFNVPPSELPLLENATYFGLYYRSLAAHLSWNGVDIDGHMETMPQMLITQMLLQLRLTCIICPNLQTLATDINVCLALAEFEVLQSQDPNENESNGDDGKITKKRNLARNMAKNKMLLLKNKADEEDDDFLDSLFAGADKNWEEKNASVTTFKVTIPDVIFPFRLIKSSDFNACMASYWPTMFPSFHKLIVKVDMWPHEDVGLYLPGLLNIPGITDLEIINYYQDWIGQTLGGSASLANLQQGLRHLRLSARQIKLGTPTEWLEKLVGPLPIKWPEDVFSLCDYFEALEEVVIDRRVFLDTSPVVGKTTTDNGVKINVL